MNSFVAILLLTGICLTAAQNPIPCLSTVDLVKIGDQVSLKSPNYPNLYPRNDDKNQCINSPPNTKLKLTCKNVDMGKCRRAANNRVSGDFMYVSLKNTKLDNDMEWFCGNYVDDEFEPLISEGRSIQVGYHADAAGVSKTGYDCIVTVVGEDGKSVPDCNALTPTTTTQRIPTPGPVKICPNGINLDKVGDFYQIKTPNYPGLYDLNRDYNDCVSSPAGTRLQVSCSHFDMSPTCPLLRGPNLFDGDYMYISVDGDSSLITTKAYCGSSLTPVTSNSNKIIVGYHTNYLSSVKRTGYDCKVTVVV